jgi:hypothetical protein
MRRSDRRQVTAPMATVDLDELAALAEQTVADRQARAAALWDQIPARLRESGFTVDLDTAQYRNAVNAQRCLVAAMDFADVARALANRAAHNHTEPPK